MTRQLQRYRLVIGWLAIALLIVAPLLYADGGGGPLAPVCGGQKTCNHSTSPCAPEPKNQFCVAGNCMADPQKCKDCGCYECDVNGKRGALCGCQCDIGFTSCVKNTNGVNVCNQSGP